MMRSRCVFLIVIVAAVALAHGDDRFSVGANALGGGRAVTVHLPAEYADASARFPVLYVMDADVHLSHAIASCEFLARVGRIPPMIVVGVTSDDNRVRDFTPTRGALVGAGGRVEFPDSGGAAAFAAVLGKELIPLIDARYRTRPFRILAGHSLGGLFALYAAAQNELSFDAAIAASPTLTWDDDYVEQSLGAFLKDPKAARRYLFVMMGREEAPNVAAFHRLQALLTETTSAAIRWSVALAEDEDHNSTPLVAFNRGLRFAFDGWRAPVASFRDLHDLERHYRELSERLRYAVQPPEQTLNSFGYRQLNTGNLVEAVRVFRRNVELYPASANVYDSLGDALERSRDYSAARDAYAKAVEIARANKDPNVAGFSANLTRVEALLQKQN